MLRDIDTVRVCVGGEGCKLLVQTKDSRKISRGVKGLEKLLQNLRKQTENRSYDSGVCG